MPIHKNAFQSCTFDKNLLQKKIIMAVGKGFTKQLKSVFESKNIRLKNKASEAFVFSKKSMLKIAKSRHFNFVFVVIFNYIL